MSCQPCNRRSGAPSRLLSRHVMVFRQLTCHNSRALSWLTEYQIGPKSTSSTGSHKSLHERPVAMFGVTELSENAQWVNASIAFAVDGFGGAQKIKEIPSLPATPCQTLHPRDSFHCCALSSSGKGRYSHSQAATGN